MLRSTAKFGVLTFSLSTLWLPACSDRDSDTAAVDRGSDAAVLQEAGASESDAPVDVASAEHCDAGDCATEGDTARTENISDGGSEVSTAPIDAGNPTSILCAEYIAKVQDGTVDLAAIADVFQLGSGFVELVAGRDIQELSPAIEQACAAGTRPEELRHAVLTTTASRWKATIAYHALCVGDVENDYETSAQIAAALGVSEDEVAVLLGELDLEAPGLGEILSVIVASRGEGADALKTEWWEAFVFELYELSLTLNADISPFDSLPEVEVDRVIGWSSAISLFRLKIRQPYDHFGDPEPSFLQTIDVVISNLDGPTILGTGGYAFSDYGDAEWMLEANHIGVGHRFYIEPPTDPALWKFLTPEQAARDVHRVVELLKPALPGPWISAGSSKGGSTALLHRRFFPNDVVGTIAQVSPLGFDNDPDRGLLHLDSIDEGGCAERVRQEQRLLLDQLVNVRDMRAERVCFRALDPNALLAAASLFEWGFWTQRIALECDTITGEGATNEELAEQLEQALLNSFGTGTGTPWEYEKLATWGTPSLVRSEILPLVEQARVDLGIAEPGLPPPPPWGEPPVFDPAPMREAKEWIANEGSGLLLFYGEYDPWSSWPVDLGQANASLSVLIPKGLHWASYRQASVEDQAQVRALLETWVDPSFVKADAFKTE